MSTELDQVLYAARKLNANAMATLLELFDQRVNRLAMGLCGQPRVGRKVVRIVMRQALDAIPKLRDIDSVERWFNHRTVLESRQHAGSSREETLRDGAPRQDANYVAFVRAFRSLPAQQREAFVLTHGERLNARYVGVAMDCSADAAANHLRAATEGLRVIAGDAFSPLLESLVTTYRSLAPPPETTHREVRQRVSRFLFPRRLRRTLIWLLIAVVAFAMWHWWPVIRARLPW